jgi:brefeldin A-resistance guanine nucleotide exchange factor 1
VHDIFVNCDCRIERSDLYADICALVSRTAFPVSQKSLGPLHHISLEALMALLGALSQGLAAPLLQLQPSDELPRWVQGRGCRQTGAPGRSEQQVACVAWWLPSVLHSCPAAGCPVVAVL